MDFLDLGHSHIPFERLMKIPLAKASFRRGFHRWNPRISPRNLFKSPTPMRRFPTGPGSYKGPGAHGFSQLELHSNPYKWPQKKWVFTVFFFTPVTGPYFVGMYEFPMFFVGAPLVMENPHGYFYVVVGLKRGKSTMEIEVLIEKQRKDIVARMGMF